MSEHVLYIRAPEALIRSAKKAAKSADRSLASFVRQALIDAVQRAEDATEPPEKRPVSRKALASRLR